MECQMGQNHMIMELQKLDWFFMFMELQDWIMELQRWIMELHII